MIRWRGIVHSARTLLNPVREETGQALAEYSLILVFIAAACVIALGVLGLALAGQLDIVADAFP